MTLTNINSDWMSNASSGLYITYAGPSSCISGVIIIYVDPLSCILGCNDYQRSKLFPSFELIISHKSNNSTVTRHIIICYARLLPQNDITDYWPLIWRVLPPTMFPGSTLLFGPKHSTSVPFSAVSAVPLSVDVKKVAPLVPNPVSDLAVKKLVGRQIGEVVVCTRAHSFLPPTLQMVSPLMSPVTVHWKVKESPRQVWEAAVNCPVTAPREK